MAFYDAVNWHKGGINPFDDFEEYSGIQEKIKRLKDFETTGNPLLVLQDLICEKLQVKYFKGKYKMNDSQVFAVCYLLESLSGYTKNETSYLFIDEFQDLSNTEMELLVNVYPNSIFNLFGDFNQCINPKGMHSISDFLLSSKFGKPFIINENYRNAKEITRYVNNRFSMKMLEIGLEGNVYKNSMISLYRLQEGDRAAIIVSDKYDKKMLPVKDKVFFYDEMKYISRNAYTVIPVSLVKGLEFEVVIVVAQGMSDNQMYVACTRAIRVLQIVE